MININQKKPGPGDMSGRTLINLVTFLSSLIDHVIAIPKTNNPEQVKDFRLVIKQ